MAKRNNKFSWESVSIFGGGFTSFNDLNFGVTVRMMESLLSVHFTFAKQTLVVVNYQPTSFISILLCHRTRFTMASLINYFSRICLDTCTIKNTGSTQTGQLNHFLYISFWNFPCFLVFQNHFVTPIVSYFLLNEVIISVVFNQCALLGEPFLASPYW